MKKIKEPTQQNESKVEQFWDNISKNDENTLMEYFVNMREYNGTSIIKDNIETEFDKWSERLSIEDIIDILK